MEKWYKTTVWKFQNFSITHFLREIKVGDFCGPKFAILTQSEALNFDFYEFLHFLKAEIDQISTIQSSKNLSF